MNILKLLVQPINETNPLNKRKELILNILLIGSGVLSFLISVISIKNYTIMENYTHLNPGVFLSATAFFVFLFLLNKLGKRKLSSYLLIVFYAIPTVLISYTWSVHASQALLLYILLIIISGLLINKRVSIITTSIISVYILSLTWLQEKQIITSNLYWSNSYTTKLEDSLIIILALFLIMIICCLYNDHMNQTIRKLKKTQKKLKQERKNLEKKVNKRTQKIKKMQIEKMNYLYRFAEFGKLSGGILHDLITPLTALNLNLKQLEKTNQIQNQSYLQEAIKISEKSQNLIRGVKKQLKKQESKQTFSLNQEIQETLSLIKYKAKKKKVEINFEADQDIKIYGDPLKFNQIILNLVDNAIESYHNHPKPNQTVTLRLSLYKNKIYLIIEDTGKGIPPKYLHQIFTPFFSTKKSESDSLGVGLASVKNIIEQDFKGDINIQSEVNKGTKIIISFSYTHMKEIKDIIQTQHQDFSNSNPEKLFTPLEIIKSKQHSQGGWEKDNFYSSLVKTALILNSLNTLEETSQVQTIKQQAVNYLLESQSGNRLYETIGITFEALSALCRYKESIIEGDSVAKILMILTEAESQEGGPYYTDQKNQTQDLAININIALFLQTQKVELDPLDKFFNTFLQEDNIKETFYKNPYLTLYKLAKFKAKPAIANYINKHFPKSNFNQIVAYITLAYINPSYIQDLDIEPLKKNLSINPLENALFLELEQLQNTPPKTNTPKKAETSNSTADISQPVIHKKNSKQNKKVNLSREFKHAFYHIQQEIHQAPSEFQSSLKEILKNTVLNETNQEVLVTPLKLYNSLNSQDRDKISKKKLRYLTEINNYIWMAYPVLNKVLHHNSKSQNVLFSQFYFKHIFNKITSLKNSEPSQLFFSLSNTSEKYHYLENKYNWVNLKQNTINLSDITNFTEIYDKNSIFLFPVLSLLFIAGYKQTDQVYTNIYEYFKEYFKYKQIIQELNTWLEDLKQGKLTQINYDILQEFQSQGIKNLNLDKHRLVLEKMFWFKILPQYHKYLQDHLSQLKQKLSQSDSLKSSNPLLSLIISLESHLTQTFDSYYSKMSFLNKKDY